MKLPIKLLYPDSKMPLRAGPHEAGLDLYLHRVQDQDDASQKESNHVTALQDRYYTGVAMAIPEGYVGLLLMRSSVSSTPGRFANCVGVIDCTYRGEIYAVMEPVAMSAAISTVCAHVLGMIDTTPKDQHEKWMTDWSVNSVEMIKQTYATVNKLSYQVGDRFAQLVIVPIPSYTTEQVDSLPESTRGDAGFGSSGNK